MGALSVVTNLDAVIERKRQTGELFTREEIEAQSLVVPAVNVIVSELRKRPYWQQGQPLPVPSALWMAARDEMKAIMEKRGYKLPMSESLTRAGVAHFLIHGTVIVAS